MPQEHSKISNKEALIQAQNLKKILKDKRRKQYEDLQVQGTNNSSIVSKRSVEMIYQAVSPAGEWFKYFVPRGKRRSPAINRGYWLRMESIRKMISRIVSESNENINIVNLGCGFDPLPFQMLADGKRYKFYDIDYPELVENKAKMIREAAEICLVIGDEQCEGIKGSVINTSNYKLIGCDLKDVDRYEEILGQLPPGLTIFIAEVSLAYMHFSDANKIIEISSKVPNSHMVVLEQILPGGKEETFGAKMLAHFSKLRSSLKCVEQYPQKQDQINRFKQFFPEVEVRDLFECWIDLVDEEVKRAVDLVESFDEWEEFIMFCQHYVIVHATNSGKELFAPPFSEFPSRNVVEHETKYTETLNQIKFAAGCRIGTDYYVHGGMGQTRSANMYKNGEEIECFGDVPGARMCHEMVAINSTELLMFGGRTRPGEGMKDVVRFDINTNKWTQLAPLPYGVYRHQVVRLNDNEVMVIGGEKNAEKASDDEQQANDIVLVYNHTNQTHHTMTVESAPFLLRYLSSFGCVYNSETNIGYIIGGLVDFQVPKVNNDVIKFWVQKKDKCEKIVCKVEETLPEFGRIGARVVAVANSIYIVGGINYHQNLNRSQLVIKYEVGQDIEEIAIDWRKTMMIGHNAWYDDGTERVVVINGGAVCYSFGSVYSGKYEIII